MDCCGEKQLVTESRIMRDADAGGPVVKRFLEQHPAEPQEEAVSLVAQALSEAFPCKQ
jgi:hypothetical protein